MITVYSGSEVKNRDLDTVLQIQILMLWDDQTNIIDKNDIFVYIVGSLEIVNIIVT